MLTNDTQYFPDTTSSKSVNPSTSQFDSETNVTANPKVTIGNNPFAVLAANDDSADPHIDTIVDGATALDLDPTLISFQI